MIFALLHATLGWFLALLACALLRRRSAASRCWAWRLGLLKGPLALLLAVPVAVSMNLPSPKADPPQEATTLPIPVSPATARIATIAPSKTAALEEKAVREAVAEPAPKVSSSQTSAPLSVALLLLYAGGVLSVFGLRILSLRRVHTAMPRVEGVLHPHVVVPPGLAPEAATMALAHENAHIDRRDPQWSFVADLVCAAFWFAPPVWLCARAMRAEAEAACDAAALAATGAAKREYARLLLAFAGPAPANALGGPARRLARRILMLEKSAKPLPRFASASLFLLGLLVLMPWKAEARPQSDLDAGKGPLRAFGMGVQATRIPLKIASSLMLEEPGVREKVGWKAEQNAMSEARRQRWNTVMDEYRAEMVRRQKSGTLREFFKWDGIARKEAFENADKAAGWPVQTPEQTHILKSLALARFGSAVWKDPEVAGRLRLTPAQVNAITKENAAIAKVANTPDMRGELLHPTPKMPPAVSAKVKAATQAYIDAPLEKRPQLYIRIANLKRPYEPVFRSQTPQEYKARTARQLEQSWTMRAEADRRLETILSAEQKRTLETLKNDPTAWETNVGERNMAPASIQSKVSKTSPQKSQAKLRMLRTQLAQAQEKVRHRPNDPQFKELADSLRTAVSAAEVQASDRRIETLQKRSLSSNRERWRRFEAFQAVQLQVQLRSLETQRARLKAQKRTANARQLETQSKALRQMIEIQCAAIEAQKRKLKDQVEQRKSAAKAAVTTRTLMLARGLKIDGQSFDDLPDAATVGEPIKVIERDGATLRIFRIPHQGADAARFDYSIEIVRKRGASPSSSGSGSSSGFRIDADEIELRGGGKP